MVFEMSLQEFDVAGQDNVYPHHNGGLDYRDGSFVSEDVSRYPDSETYHSDSQVGTVFIRISIPEIKVQKCLQFELDETVWQAKQRILGTFAKDLRDSINHGLYCPPMNGRAGKFLDEERLLREYPLQGPIGFLEFKYKKRVYKMMHVNPRKLKQLHVKSNLRHFIDHVKTFNIEKVTKLTNKGLDPNFHDSSTGETPLCLAVTLAKQKCREMIMCLAGGGAHLDFRNKKGMTALHKAVILGNTEAIKALLDLGVSPNMKDSRSLTPLYYTVLHCTSPLCMEMLLQERAFIGSQDEQGWFEIHHACRQGLVQHVEHLLFYGADMDVQNASGNTPLHVCALHNRESCLRVLLFRGANKEILNYTNQTPYECALLGGNEAIAEIIDSHKIQDIVPFRETPRFSNRRRDSMASAALYALYRSRSDPRINLSMISPSSSSHSFTHLHNSLTTDSGSRGTDSPCSMSLSSSSSGPGFFRYLPDHHRRPMSVCQSMFTDKRYSSLSQFEVIKRRLTPQLSFRSLRSNDRLHIELQREIHRRHSLQIGRSDHSLSSALGYSYLQNHRISPSLDSINSSARTSPMPNTFSISPSMDSLHRAAQKSPVPHPFSCGRESSISIGDNVDLKSECGYSQSESLSFDYKHYQYLTSDYKQSKSPDRHTICASDSTIYRVISKPKRRRSSLKYLSQSDAFNEEKIYANSKSCKDIQNDIKKEKEHHAKEGRKPRSSSLSENQSPMTTDAKLELETDHIFVCIEPYMPRTPDELALELGDVVEVLGIGEQGFWEGRVNGNEGMFPSNYVQEVKLRRKAGSLGDLVSATRDFNLNRNTLAAMAPMYSEYAPRSVVLQKGPEGFGFVLRGAKSQTHATAELDFRPTAEFPALQYLDSVDPGSRSDRAGLKSGDFILEINGENVVRASHDRVVQLIRQSGDTLALKVVTVKSVDKPDHWHQNGSMTLPNRGGGQSKRQAPQPPQRDPHTSLSFTKTQGKQIAEGMAELERNVEELNSATNDQLDLALAEYERQSSQSVITSEQKTASIRSKHSAKRVSCIELDKIENPDAMSSTTNTKVKSKDYMSPSELRIQKYHHNKKTNGLERSSSTPSLLDTKKNETVYATPSVPSVEQSEMGHRRSSSGATSHIYATPGERPKAPPPPPPGGSTTPKRPAPAPPSTKSEVVTINTENRKSSYTGVTEVSVSSGKSASEYESSFRPGISAQLSTEPKITTPSLEHAKLKSHSRNSSQISLQSSDSAGSKRSEEKLAVTFAEDKVQEHAKSFLQKHPNAQLLVTADVHDKNKLRKFSEPEPDYEGNSDEEKDKNKVTVINVGVKPDSSKKYKIHSDIPSSADIVIPPPPSEPAPKPPSQKPPSPLPKPTKQADSKPRLSVTEQIKVEASLKSEEEVSPAIPADVSIPSPSVKEEEAPPIPQAPPPPPPPPAPPLLVESNVNKPKTPPPVAKQKPVSPLLQGIQKEDLLNAVEQRKNRMENEGLKISKGPNKEAPVKNSNDLRSRMIDNTQAAILAAVAKRRALLEEKESDTAVADEIENRLQKTKKLQSAKYYFSSETIQKEKTNNAPKIDTKLEASAKDITPTIDKVKTPTPVAVKVGKPPSPGIAKKNKPPSPVPIQKAKPVTSSEKAKVTSPVKKDSTSGITKQSSQASKSSGIPVSTKTRPPSPKVVRKEPVKENTIQDKKPDSEMKIQASDGDKKTENVNGDKENEDFVAKAEKARRDWLQKKSSSSSIKQNSPRDGAKSKANSPRRAPSDVAKNSVKVEVASVKKDVVSAKTGSPKTNGMTLPLKNDTETETNSKTKRSFKASSPIRTTPLKTPEKSGIIPMKATKDSDVISKTKNIKDRIKNFEQGKPVMNGEVTSPKSKISVQGVTVDHSVTDKSPALPPPPEFGDAVQLEIIPPPTEFNINDNLESPTYNSAFQHDDSSSVSTMSTLSDDHMDGRSKSSYEDMIAPPPPGFDDNSNFEPSVIPPPPDFGENKSKLNKNVSKPFQSKSVDTWQCLDVLDWLDSVNMAQYKKSFQQHCIDGKKLSGLQRNDYIQLGVTQVGHRMTMERSIKKANLLKGTHL